jgi:hypothetical protein
LSYVYTKSDRFYQDRLGTNTGKTHNKNFLFEQATFNGRLLHKEYDQYTFSLATNDTENPDKHRGGPKFISHPSIGQADSCLLAVNLLSYERNDHFPRQAGDKCKEHSPKHRRFCRCLLGFPLQFNASSRLWGGHKDEVRLNDISYYGPRVSPDGSYMTAGYGKRVSSFLQCHSVIAMI